MASSFEETAPLFCAGYTALSGSEGPSRDRASVAVVGIGGVDHLAVRYAKALGHEVVASTGSDDQAAQLAELGADHVVRPDGHAGEALMAAGGADVIVCTTNSAAHVSRALAGLLPEGGLVNLGALDGPIELEGVGVLHAETARTAAKRGRRAHSSCPLLAQGSK